jgi:hypothetical protein
MYRNHTNFNSEDGGSKFPRNVIHLQDRYGYNTKNHRR